MDNTLLRITTTVDILPEVRLRNSKEIGNREIPRNSLGIPNGPRRTGKTIPDNSLDPPSTSPAFPSPQADHQLPLSTESFNCNCHTDVNTIVVGFVVAVVGKVVAYSCEFLG